MTNHPCERFLPHHPVFHQHKLRGVRRVLKGAAKFHGHSLKIALLTGSDLLQKLIHVLLRFRKHPYAVSTDMEGMFLQVGFIPKDRPSPRCLWREDTTTEVAVFQNTPTFLDQRIRQSVPTTFFNKLLQATRVSFQKPQKVSCRTFTWMTI